MARSNVVEHKGLGWCHSLKNGHPEGWVYRFNVKLECGHETQFVSTAYQNRSLDVPPPAWVECKECE